MKKIDEVNSSDYKITFKGGDNYKEIEMKDLELRDFSNYSIEGKEVALELEYSMDSYSFITNDNRLKDDLLNIILGVEKIRVNLKRRMKWFALFSAISIVSVFSIRMEMRLIYSIIGYVSFGAFLIFITFVITRPDTRMLEKFADFVKNR